jgi:tripartite-type tricarboxylate transporter receptor subunit TctC
MKLLFRATTCLLAYTVSTVAAQTPLTGAGAAYPSKPIRLVLPFPTGGPTDLLGRQVGLKLTEFLGQPVVPENRPGVGGNLGPELAAKSPADGYTIVLSANTLAISPSLYRKLNYDPINDLAPLSLVAQVRNIFITHPSIPAKTLKELISAARNNPGKLTFGSGGVGTSQHLAGEMFRTYSRLDTLHVPYKGSGMAMLAMIGGHVDIMFIGVPPAIPHVQSGRVRALAALSEDRIAVLPHVPTAKESGFPGYEMTSWYGFLAPAKTPRDIIHRLNAELIKVVNAPDTRERLAAGGFEPMTSTPDQFSEFIKNETVRYAKVIKEAKVELQ